MKKRLFAMVLVMMLLLNSMQVEVYAKKGDSDKSSKGSVLTETLKDQTTVKVSKAPEGATLTVKMSSSEDYEKAIQNECGSEYSVITALNISVVTKESLKNKVKITVKADDFKKISKDAVLYHIKDGKAKSLKYKLDTKKGTIKFKTKDFSPFVLIVPVEEKESETEEVSEAEDTTEVSKEETKDEPAAETESEVKKEDTEVVKEPVTEKVVETEVVTETEPETKEEKPADVKPETKEEKPADVKPETKEEKPADTKPEEKVSPVDVKLSGKVTLKGRDLEAEEFSFTLKGSDDVSETVKNAADGKISFTTLTFNEAGTYTYTVKQDETSKGGVTIDSKTYTITVKVTDDGHGQLKAEISGDSKSGNDLNFADSYDAAPVDVQFGGHKTFKNFPEDSTIVPKFTFDLSENGSVIESKTVKKQGDYKFKKITYKKEGVYTYTIKERTGKQAGVTYDKKSYTVKVTVKDNKEGKLVATISGDSKTGKDLDFKNTYKPSPVSVKFSGTKTLTGKKLTAKEFSFTLKGSNDVKETVKNDADGKISFSKLTYKKAGVYTYTVKEDSTNEAGIITDNKVYKITVTVTDDGSGELKAAISGDTKTGKDLKFKNEYKTGALVISKTVNGDLGDKNKLFTFTVTFSNTGKFSYTGSKSGTISSGESFKLKHGESITITGIPVGVNYNVVESDNADYKVYKTGDSGQISATGDTKVSFTNTKSSVPQTGDNSNLSLWIGLLIAAILGVIALLAFGRKKQ